MTRVYLIKGQALGRFPATWSIYRVGTGPGRGEGCGFKTAREARAWAAERGLEIVGRNAA